MAGEGERAMERLHRLRSVRWALERSERREYDADLAAVLADARGACECYCAENGRHPGCECVCHEADSAGVGEDESPSNPLVVEAAARATTKRNDLRAQLATAQATIARLELDMRTLGDYWKARRDEMIRIHEEQLTTLRALLERLEGERAQPPPDTQLPVSYYALTPEDWAALWAAVGGA